MLFEKPSLRTRVSFETGMTQMGGHAIFYSTADSPLGKKENIHDTAKCVSRYVNVIMARLNKRQDMRDLALHSDVPCINALDDFAHPCQMLADLQTITEKLGTYKGIKLTFSGGDIFSPIAVRARVGSDSVDKTGKTAATTSPTI